MSELKLFNGIGRDNRGDYLRYSDEYGHVTKEYFDPNDHERFTALESKLNRELEQFEAKGWKPTPTVLQDMRTHGVWGLLRVLSSLRLHKYMEEHPLHYAAKQLQLTPRTDPTAGVKSIYYYRSAEATLFIRKLLGADNHNRHALTHSKPFTASLVAKVTRKAGEGQSKTFMRVFESPQFCTFAVQLVKSDCCFLLDDWAVERWGDERIRFAENRSLRVRDIWQLLFRDDMDMTVCSFENGLVEYAKPPKYYATAMPRILNPATDMPKFQRILQDLSEGKDVKPEDIEAFNAARNTDTLDYARKKALNSPLETKP